MLAHIGQASAIGTPEQCAEAVRGFVSRTQADEIILAGPTFDPQARIDSLSLAMQALG